MMKNPLAALRPLTARWATLDPREQRLIGTAAGVLGLALIWWLALAPALGVLRQASERQRQLDTQWQQMQRLQAEARALQSQPKLGYDEALRALEASVKALGGSGQLNVVGDRATVTLKNTSPDALAQWLTQARVNAKAIPAEARLVRHPATAADAPAGWDGTLVLNLPAR